MRSIEQMMNMFNNNKSSIKSDIYTYKDVELSRESLFNELIKLEAKIEVYNELSLEGIYPYMFSTEGFGDTIRNIGKKIIEFIKNLIKKFIDFCKKVWGWITGIFKKNKDTEFIPIEEIKKRSTKNNNDKKQDKTLPKITIKNFKSRSNFIQLDVSLLDKLYAIRIGTGEDNSLTDEIHDSIEYKLEETRINKVKSILKFNTNQEAINALNNIAKLRGNNIEETINNLKKAYPNEFTNMNEKNIIDLILIALNPISYNSIDSIGDSINQLTNVYPDIDLEEFYAAGINERKKIAEDATINYFYESNPPKDIEIDPLELYTKENIEMETNEQFNKKFAYNINRIIKEIEKSLLFWERSVQNLNIQYDKFTKWWNETKEKGLDPKNEDSDVYRQNEVKEKGTYQDNSVILKPTRNRDHLKRIEFNKGSSNPDANVTTEHVLSQINGEYTAVQGWFQYAVACYSILIHQIQASSKIILDQKAAIKLAYDTIKNTYKLSVRYTESDYKNANDTIKIFLEKSKYFLKNENLNKEERSVILSDATSLIDILGGLDKTFAGDDKMPHVRYALQEIAKLLNAKVSNGALKTEFEDIDLSYGIRNIMNFVREYYISDNIIDIDSTIILMNKLEW